MWHCRQTSPCWMRAADLAWLQCSLLVTLTSFICSLSAAVTADWFHIHCFADAHTIVDPGAGAGVGVGAGADAESVFAYRFGLWKLCGGDPWWEGANTTAAPPMAKPKPGHHRMWRCLELDAILAPDRPTWLHGTRSLHVFGCVVSGVTLLLMLVHLPAPNHLSRSASTGFMVANLTAALLFALSLMTVFAVQVRSATLLPVGVCHLAAMPSAYCVTLTAVSIGMSVIAVMVTAAVSEAHRTAPPSHGGRGLRKSDN